MDYYTTAKKFILKNSRPLDMARWNYLFENGSKENVISALKAYQNDDGGFANALEPDCWNINSTPLQTWVATQIIKEINLEDKTHPIIKGILDYLSSKDEFDGHRLHGLNTVVTNDNYPHAPWWSYRQKQIKKVITYDTKIWSTDYICKPSLFINSKSSDFYLENKEICDFEYKFILKTQNEDGSWGVTWEWNDYPEQWSISKNWWQSDIIIKNIKYIRELN